MYLSSPSLSSHLQAQQLWIPPMVVSITVVH